MDLWGVITDLGDGSPLLERFYRQSLCRVFQLAKAAQRTPFRQKRGLLSSFRRALDKGFVECQAWVFNTIKWLDGRPTKTVLATWHQCVLSACWVDSAKADTQKVAMCPFSSSKIDTWQRSSLSSANARPRTMHRRAPCGMPVRRKPTLSKHTFSLSCANARRRPMHRRPPCGPPIR